MNFIKNNSTELSSIKRQNIVVAPTNAPKMSLLNDVFLFSRKETVISNMKSKAKFNKKTKSKYIFIASPYTV